MTVHIKFLDLMYQGQDSKASPTPRSQRTKSHSAIIAGSSKVFASTQEGKDDAATEVGTALYAPRPIDFYNSRI